VALADETAQNKRLERTRHERVSLLSRVSEPLKRNVRWLVSSESFGQPLGCFLTTFYLLAVFSPFSDSENIDYGNDKLFLRDTNGHGPGALIFWPRDNFI
jgi:hypothetical protein